MTQLQQSDKSSFWLVWSPRGGPSRVRHEAYDLATAEAERLSHKHQGQHFYVLECVGFCMEGEETLTTRQAATLNRSNGKAHVSSTYS